MYSVNKGADRQCFHRTADLHLCFRTHLQQVFSWCDSFSTIPTLLSPIILSFMNLRLRMLLFFSFDYLFIHLFIHLPILFIFYFLLFTYYLYIYIFLLFILLIYLSVCCSYALETFCHVDCVTLYTVLAGDDVTSFDVTPT